MPKSAVIFILFIPVIFPLLDKGMTIIYTFEIGPLPARRSRSCKFRSLLFRVVSTDRDIGHWLRVHVENLLEPLGQSPCHCAENE